jgi:low temperature requirement protein LtrA
VIGESVVVVALETSGSDWRLDSAAAAVLGFAAVAAVWWLYFDQQANVVLRGTSPSPVVYSYAHLPLLMGLAAMSAGLCLVIERAGEGHLGAGASVAFLGGVVLFLLSLVATRFVTVSGPRKLGVSLKLGTAAIILGLLVVEGALRPVALASGLAGILAMLVFAERTLILRSQSGS